MGSDALTRPGIDTVAPVFEARDIHKRFAAVQALDGVSMALHPGEVRALVGEMERQQKP